MGIESEWDGIIDFQPPFILSALKGTVYENMRQGGFDFALVVKRDDEHVTDEDGWEVRRTRTRVIGVKAAFDHSFKGYGMKLQLEAFLETLKKKKVMPTRFYGFIEKLTEDGALSRFYVREGVVHEVEATISWPGWED